MQQKPFSIPYIVPYRVQIVRVNIVHRRHRNVLKSGSLERYYTSILKYYLCMYILYNIHDGHNDNMYFDTNYYFLCMKKNMLFMGTKLNNIVENK